MPPRRSRRIAWSWQTADAQALPFPDQSFDAVVCQFGAMFFPDRVQAYREARRVLKPRGHFIFNVWDAIEHNEFAELVTAAVADMFANDPPGFLARTPHGYHDRDRIVAEVRGAGFAEVTVETVTRRSVAPTCRDPAIGFCQKPASERDRGARRRPPRRGDRSSRGANCRAVWTRARRCNDAGARHHGERPCGVTPDTHRSATATVLPRETCQA